MNMQTFKQQLIGIINLSMPIVIIYNLYPALLSYTLGKLTISLVIGAYVYFLGRQITNAQAKGLLYSPTGVHKENFEKIISECAMNPHDVNIRYGYSNEMIAMTILNTVSIDPLYSNVPAAEQDPEMIKVKDILDVHIGSALSAEQKTRLQNIKEILTEPAQRFIFKHELAHVHDNYSNKKLMVNGLIGFLAAYCGISIGMMLIPYNGFVALLCGMLAGGIADLLFTYVSNVLFTAREEKQADLFAAKHSSKEEILAAADFFEKHQMILDRAKINLGIMGKIPSVILNGHHNGFDRAAVLRNYESLKMN